MVIEIYDQGKASTPQRDGRKRDSGVLEDVLEKHEGEEETNGFTLRAKVSPAPGLSPLLLYFDLNFCIFWSGAVMLSSKKDWFPTGSS